MEKIQKSDVEEIINDGCYECVYHMYGESKSQVYDGCVYNLLMILNDESTDVTVANDKNPDYKDGYRTIVMDVPVMDAIILIRIVE